MLSDAQIQHAADALYAAEASRLQIEPLTLSHPEMDMDDAYKVQSAWGESQG